MYGVVPDTELRSNDAREHPSSNGEPNGEPAQAPAGKPKRKPLYRRPVFVVPAATVFVAGVIAVVVYLVRAAKYESTDDAFVDGHVTHVAPRIAGLVEHVYVKDNRIVHRGDVLFDIDTEKYELALARAEAAQAVATAREEEARAAANAERAQVSASRSALQQAEAEQELAATNLKRAAALFASHSVSQQSLDDARTAARSAEAAVARARQQVAAARATQVKGKSSIVAAEADVKQAETAVDAARLELSYSHVRAAIDGRVTKRSVEPGDYVEPGQQVLLLVDLNVWVTANFKETQLAHMRPGQPVTIDVDAYGRTWSGRVDSLQEGTGSVFGLLPPENATGNYVKVVQRIPVKIVFDPLPDPHRYLLAPGMSAVPTVRVTSELAAPMVPVATPSPRVSSY